MRNAETVLGIIRERKFEAETTGELLEIERLTSSSEGGRWKSATGNSPAAYPTARPVLRRGGEGDLPSLPDHFARQSAGISPPRRWKRWDKVARQRSSMSR